MNDKRKIVVGLITAGVVFLTVAAIFAVNVRNDFLRFDDALYITSNQAIADGVMPKTVAWSFRSAGYASNWHPLTWMSHALDNTLSDGFGLKWRAPKNSSGIVVDPKLKSFSRFVHGENVLLHAVNAVLLWLLMVLLLRADAADSGDHVVLLPVAAFFSLLWAVHPLRVEVVAWASERKELLCVFFMLMTLVLYVWEETQGHLFGDAVKSPFSSEPALAKAFAFVSSHAQVLVMVFYMCALLSKPVAVSFPAIIFAYNWLIRQRSFRDSVAHVLPFVAMAIVTCWLTMASQADALATGREWDVVTRFFCVVNAPIVYLRQTIWPFGLAIDYPFPDGSITTVFVLGCLLLLGLVVLALVVLWRKALQPETSAGTPSVLDLVAFAAAWTYVGLLPMIGIVKVGFEPHSDRYTYWIGCGATTFAAFLTRRLVSDSFLRRRAILVSAACLLLALSGLSIRQSLTWKDTESLFSDAVSKSHGEMFAQGLGELYEERGGDSLARAETLLRHMVELKHTPAARGALALHLASYADGNEKRLQEAHDLAEHALNEDPSAKWAYAALGFWGQAKGRASEAFKNMKKAYELGYTSRVIKIDMTEWERAADLSSRSQSNVQR